MTLIIYGPKGENITPVVIAEFGMFVIGRTNHHENIVMLQGDIVPDSPRVIAEGHSSINIENHLGVVVSESGLTLTDNKSEFGSSLDGVGFVSRYIHRPGKYTLKLGNVEFGLEYSL